MPIGHDRSRRRAGVRWQVRSASGRVWLLVATLALALVAVVVAVAK
jgi:hypothetical protein